MFQWYRYERQLQWWNHDLPRARWSRARGQRVTLTDAVTYWLHILGEDKEHADDHEEDADLEGHLSSHPIPSCQIHGYRWNQRRSIMLTCWSTRSRRPTRLGRSIHTDQKWKWRWRRLGASIFIVIKIGILWIWIIDGNQVVLVVKIPTEDLEPVCRCQINTESVHWSIVSAASIGQYQYQVL
jgi:hypothetical protein